MFACIVRKMWIVRVFVCYFLLPAARAQVYTLGNGGFEAGFSGFVALGSAANTPTASFFTESVSAYNIVGNSSSWIGTLTGSCNMSARSGNFFMAVRALSATGQWEPVWSSTAPSSPLPGATYRLQFWSRGLTNETALQFRVLVSMMSPQSGSPGQWDLLTIPAESYDGTVCLAGWKYHYVDIDIYVTYSWFFRVDVLTSSTAVLFGLDDLWFGPVWEAPGVPLAAQAPQVHRPAAGNLLLNGDLESSSGWQSDYVQQVSMNVGAAGSYQLLKASFGHSWNTTATACRGIDEH